MQLIQVALAPARSAQTQPGDEYEQRGEEGQRDPLRMIHDYFRVATYTVAVHAPPTTTQSN